MTQGARNIHALAATLRRLEHEAANGQCAICGKPSVGFITAWDSIPRGICERHANTAPLHGYTVNHPALKDGAAVANTTKVHRETEHHP